MPNAQDLPLRDSEEIQGNILAGFKKDHRFYVFAQFPDGQSGRNWLKDLLPRVATTKQVATFNKLFSEARRARGGDDPESLRAVWVNVGLTADGLGTLSPTEVKTHLEAYGMMAFLEGPARRAKMLGDVGRSDPANWVVGSMGQPVHALLTVEADDPGDLEGEMSRMREFIAKHGLRILYEQRGDTLPGDLAGHEHFGFKDGISQPGVRRFDPVDPSTVDRANWRWGELLGHPGTPVIPAGEFVLGHPREGELGQDAPPRQHPAWMANGSFQVFRRLVQDVPGFWAQVIAQYQALRVRNRDASLTADLLAAKLVGRWRSGTPLACAPERDNRSGQDPKLDNKFHFADDPEGHVTPRFCHIRKMYPRNHEDHRRRILRRGIPFGKPFNPAAGRGHGVDAERGLLFNAFMASIEEQFEFLQKCANNSDFPQPDDGPDPLIGTDPTKEPDRKTGDDPLVRRTLRGAGARGAGEMKDDLDFRRFVHTTGAVYAFAPSLTTLRDLAEGNPLTA